MAEPRTAAPHLVARGEPPPDIFVPLTEQIANMRRWNEDREWGFSVAEINAIDLTPRAHSDPLVVDLIAVYLPDGELSDDDQSYLDGVRRTCHELWTVAADRQPQAWGWDWMREAHPNRPKPVRLLPGIAHRPGLRRVTVDLGAHWVPGRHIRPRNVRGPDSAHAEILAAAGHFPGWARAMNGSSVPFIWLSGYQVTFPEATTDKRVPGLAWVDYRRTLSLTVDWVDHSHSGWASPVVVG